MAHPLSREGHLERLATTKPTQVELDTAERVMRWLADHAHFRPEEYATVGDPEARETEERLHWAATHCHVFAEDLVITDEEIATRAAHNRSLSEEEA